MHTDGQEAGIIVITLILIAQWILNKLGIHIYITYVLDEFDTQDILSLVEPESTHFCQISTS